MSQFHESPENMFHHLLRNRCTWHFAQINFVRLLQPSILHRLEVDFTGQWPILSKQTDTGTSDAFNDCTFFVGMIFSFSLSLFSPRSKLLQISVRKSSKEPVPPSWWYVTNELTAANENDEKRFGDTILWYASLFDRERNTYQLYPCHPCSGCIFRHLQDGVLSDLR